MSRWTLPVRQAASGLQQSEVFADSEARRKIKRLQEWESIPLGQTKNLCKCIPQVASSRFKQSFIQEVASASQANVHQKAARDVFSRLYSRG